MNPPVLVGISPGDGRDLVPWLAALAQAGLPALCLRESPHGALYEWLAAVASVPTVMIHARTLGHRDLRALEDRTGRALGLHLPNKPYHAPLPALWSQSTHRAKDVDRALGLGASWVTLSPVFSPTSKPGDARKTLGIDQFLAIANHRQVLALGGITPARHHALVRQGAAGSAVLGGLFGAPSPGAAAQALGQYLARILHQRTVASPARNG